MEKNRRQLEQQIKELESLLIQTIKKNEELNSELKKEIEDLKYENEYLQRENNELKHDISWEKTVYE